MKESFEATLKREADPKDVAAHSRRGDAHFYLGNFDKAVGDYEKMVELEPGLAAEHWRLGIAYYYAGRFELAARQFKKYSSVDDVDRENGIWAFLSQAKIAGIEKARQGIFKYDKNDREPLPAVYAMFEGKRTPEEVLAKIGEEGAPAFYARLYVGLYLAADNKPDDAVKHLRLAVANRWPRDAGFGPNYMWHVARLHYELLESKK